MNLLLIIWRAVLNLVQSMRQDHAAQLKAIREGNAKLDQILTLLTVESADHFEFDVQVEGEPQIVGATNVTLSDSQRAQLSIRPLDKRGKPAPLDGVPTWASSDATVVTVTPGKIDDAGNVQPDASGLSAVLEGVTPSPVDADGKPIPSRVTVTGDANTAPDLTEPITGVLEVIVTAGKAVTVTIDAGTPVEIP